MGSVWVVAFSNSGLLVLPMIVFIACRVLSEPASCPQDMISEAFVCLNSLTNEEQLLAVGTDTELAIELCNHDNFDLAARCIEDLYDRCTSDKDRAILMDLAQPESLRHAFKQLCDNVEGYRAVMPCLREQEAEVHKCSSVAYHRFFKDLEKMTLYRDVFPLYCSYVRALSYCIVTPVRLNCDKDVADVLKEFTIGVSPPMCKRFVKSAAYRQVYQSSQIMTIILFLFNYMITKIA